MLKEAKDVTKQPKNLKSKQKEKEGYDDPSKKQEEPAFNSVCISSLVFAFVGIGVLLSLATWSYITTMASVDDGTRKPDHTKLHSHKHNISYHYGKQTDFTSKMDVGTADDDVDRNETTSFLKLSSLKSNGTYNDIIRRRHNITMPVMEPVTEKDDLNLDVSDVTVGSLGRRIESFSPSEIYLMRERLKSHRHTYNALMNKSRASRKKSQALKTTEKMKVKVDSL